MKSSSRSRVIAYVLAWAAALFATDPTLQLWPLAYMFPLGLAAFFMAPEHRDSPGWLVLGLVVAGYVVHAIYYFRARTGRNVLILFGILVLALVCNVSGCRGMNHPH